MDDDGSVMYLAIVCWFYRDLHKFDYIMSRATLEKITFVTRRSER